MTRDIIHLHAISPVINADIKPRETENKSKFSNTIPLSIIDFAILPKIKGITIINENLAAFSLSIPITTAVAIVAPLLDIPVELQLLELDQL